MPLLIAAGLSLAAASEDAAINAVVQGAFVRVASLREVDPVVVAELHSRIKGPIADIGEPFEPTDVVHGDPPRRRLVLAAQSVTTHAVWAVCYDMVAADITTTSRCSKWAKARRA